MLIEGSRLQRALGKGSRSEGGGGAAQDGRVQNRVEQSAGEGGDLATEGILEDRHRLGKGLILKSLWVQGRLRGECKCRGAEREVWSECAGFLTS